MTQTTTVTPSTRQVGRTQRIRTVHLVVVVLSLLALLIGTQMPGMLRDAIESQLFPNRFPFSAWAHFGLFAVASWALNAKPLQVKSRHVLWAALAVALITEGLQHFAAGRHPRLRDVGIDLSGAVMGLLVTMALGGRFSAEPNSK